MDLLKELEAKKEKLRLLKERRQLLNEGNYHATNIANDLNSVSVDDKHQYTGKNGTNHSKINMVDIAIQTDDISTELPLPVLLPPINDDSRYPAEWKVKFRTFNRGVQTDLIKEYNNHSNNSGSSNSDCDNMFVVMKGSSFDSIKHDSISPGTENELSEIFKEGKILKNNTSKLFEMKPLIIDNGFLVEHGANKINNKSKKTRSDTYESFASHWYSRGENVKREAKITVPQDIDKTQNEKVIKSNNKNYHLHTCEIRDNQNKDTRIVCKSIDFDSHRHITLIAFGVVPMMSNKQNSDMETVVPKSFVYVIDTFTDKIIDKLEFLGQVITKIKILRNNVETHNIISMILLTQRGKIILYELKKNVQEDSISWDRNILLKNYHLSCDYLNSIWETKFKLVVGDSKGYISVLNSLDLSYDITMFIKYEKDSDNDNNNYKFGNEASFLSSKIKVIPPSNSLLYTTISEEVSKETQLFIDEYLSKLVIFNELNITSIVGSPFDSDYIFLGSEDGGIYKIFLNITNHKEVLKMNKNNGSDDNKVMIDISNHGFLPKIPNEWLMLTETNLHEKILFHNGYVTSLSMDSQGLLLSSSIDWTIKLWDTKDNQILDSIDLQKPVLSVEWININNNNNNKNNNKQMKSNLLNEKYLCYAMTWDTIYIIQWFAVKEIDPDKDKRDRPHFKRDQPGKILNKVHIGQKYISYNQFTSIKLVVDTIDDNNNLINTLLILGGDVSSIDYIQMIISPY